MNSSAWRTGIATGLLLIGALCSAQAQQTRMDDKVADVSLLLKLLQLYAPQTPGLAGTTCLKTQAICTIEMQLITFGGRNYCVAVAPDVEVETQAGSGANKKIVAWKLSRSDLDGKDLAFHGDSGIILTRNQKNQVEKGGAGNGSLISPPNAYHVKTKRNELKAEAVYLPVILWGPPGKEELCAATDPKIVNVE